VIHAYAIAVTNTGLRYSGVVVTDTGRWVSHGVVSCSQEPATRRPARRTSHVLIGHPTGGQRTITVTCSVPLGTPTGFHQHGEFELCRGHGADHGDRREHSMRRAQTLGITKSDGVAKSQQG
jgi:hypothetical protein